jgi:uncharacterized protein (TIGR03437 family)
MLYKCAGLFTIAILGFLATPGVAQRNRITESLRNGKRATLSGHIPPQARADDDQGPVSRDLRIHAMTLVLKPSDAQQADLERFLAEQQDPASPNYHRWLTPEEYGDRFGVSVADMAKITDWLASQNLTVIAAGRARNWVTFSGTAPQVETAFSTELHQFLVNGEVHFSNTTGPSIPEGLTAVVRAIHGLNDFRMQPKRAIRRPAPNYNSSRGNHYLAPDDIAAIYGIQPLYDAGLNGTGQTIAVVGQTQIDIADIQKFRSDFGLPASDPKITLVPNLRDPGVSSDDEAEADLDIQWAGAVARNATIIYVYSYNVMDAVQYTIDQNLAPVISMSYGLCESQTATSDGQVLRSWAQQANAQGMTWITASGDSGGADCATSSSNGGRLAVDLPASVPEVTGIGGTQFSEGTGTYWNASNSAAKASAFTYIPEVAWNDSEATGEPSSGGGGASTVFLKPSWQVGAGVPDDGARDVPDISVAASAQHDGYLTYSGGTLFAIGGTSVGAPVVAGIAAILNQRLVASGAQPTPGLGNINPKLYSMAQTTPGAFHDIVAGNNKVTIACSVRARNCTSGSYGFDAGPAYDQATGLGSIDAYQLVMGWSGAAARAVAPSITSMSNGATFLPAFAPGMLLSVFGSQLSRTTSSAGIVPLPTQLAGVSATVNGVPAGLYYVAPGQINLQIPDSIAPGPATVTINNNGQTASTALTLAAAAPGIFAMPGVSAHHGDVATLYATGTGTSMTSLTVTVGGVPAAVQFAGVPQGFAGVVQVNYQIPQQAGAGAQPVVITVAGVSSPPVTLTVLP